MNAIKQSCGRVFAINLPDGFSDLSVFYDVSIRIGVF